MSAITKPCETCDGNGRPVTMWNGVVDCVDCDGTGRVPDVEATLRAELDAVTAQRDGLRAKLAESETWRTELRQEMDAVRGQLRDVEAQRDELREAAAGYHQAIAESTQIGSFGRRATALARLVAALETAQ